MSSWFAKVFDKKKEEQQSAQSSSAGAGHASTAPSASMPPAPRLAPPEPPKQRKVVQAPVLAAAPAPAPTDKVRIKAQIDPSGDRILLMVDRPLLAGYSCWCANRGEAVEKSPLALTLFDLGGVLSLLIHEGNLTITRDGTGHETGEDFARRIGAALRSHLESGAPVIADSYLEGMPSEEEIRAGLQAVIDEEINPGIAAHSGHITLTRVKGNTAYIIMGGGCQGCAASSITLRSGVEQSFRAAVPRLGALLDETDHAAGSNPFFTQLPAGMGG